ncbi:MAG TPA: hypothetical protein VKX25_16815 [Bryobacteraceae bacterium]|jgi:asparagine N-glycosylation enzyme membrane subunit Stt3|nr:hypothetical protein [Bryobacteraceae bacterium]
MKLADAVKIARTVKAEHARKFATHVVPEVVRPARVIWNQAIGGVFGVLALYLFAWAYQHRDNQAGLIGAIFFGAVMAFFSLTSFLSARRIARR